VQLCAVCGLRPANAPGPVLLLLLLLLLLQAAYELVCLMLIV
jgi:hypothetical protein